MEGEVQSAINEATGRYTDAQERTAKENQEVAARIETLTNELKRYNDRDEGEQPSRLRAMFPLRMFDCGARQ
jgi:hypothetical protein